MWHELISLTNMNNNVGLQSFWLVYDTVYYKWMFTYCDTKYILSFLLLANPKQIVSRMRDWVKNKRTDLLHRNNITFCLSCILLKARTPWNNLLMTGCWFVLITPSCGTRVTDVVFRCNFKHSHVVKKGWFPSPI